MWQPSVSGWGCKNLAEASFSAGALPLQSEAMSWATYELGLSSHGDELLSGQWRAVPLGQEPWAAALCVLMGLVLVAALWRGRRYLAYRLRGLFTTERRFARTGDFTAARTIPLLVGLLVVGSIAAALLFAEQFPFVGVGQERWQLCLLCMGLVAAGMCAKLAVYGLVGWTFLEKSMRRGWLGAYLLLTACMAVPMYVVCVANLRGLIGGAEVAVCLLFLLILYEIMLFYRLQSNFPKQFGIQVLVFLYFCTLEIAPLLAAGRFLSILREV